jgi:uncharacterized protein (TIGR03067 family)
MAKIQSNLNGTWFTVYQEFEGKEVSPTKFDGQKLILQESTYMIIGARVDEGIIKANGQHLDLYGTDGANKGRHYSAIFRIDKNQLTICYNLAGNAYPREFKTGGNTKFFLSRFERS